MRVLIEGGRVIDPARSLDLNAPVHVADGRIARWRKSSTFLTLGSGPVLWQNTQLLFQVLTWASKCCASSPRNTAFMCTQR